jgi:hypothetical protein
MGPHLGEKKVKECRLTGGIKCRCGFVSNDDRGPAYHGTRNCNALLLTDAEGGGFRGQKIWQTQSGAKTSCLIGPIFYPTTARRGKAQR